MATQLDALFVEIFFKGDQRALDNFKRGWKQLDDGIKNTQQTLDRFAKRFAVAGAIGSAAMGLIGKAGLETEEALLRTRAALGLTEDQMKTLHEEALKVGSQLPLNTKDIVNAQLAYGKLGASFEEILRDAPAIAGAAVATELDPEQVATYARIIQNVFGGDVQENLDMLLRTANRSPSTFAALGESIQFSGQAAVDAGMDFRAYLATLGSTAGAGRSVESVSQGMASMFGRLAKATEGVGRGGKIVGEAFQGVGINFRDVQAAMDGTSEGFINVLRLINEAELSTSQLTALLSTLAGDTYAASISYAVQNPEKLDELLAEIDSSTGEIVRQQEIILSGASGGLKLMMAQIDTLLNRLAQLGVLTAIEKFTRGMSKLVSWLTETNEKDELVRGGLLRMVTTMGGLLAALLPLGIALKAVSFALGGLVPLLKIAAWANKQFGISAKFAAFWNSNFMVSLRLAAISAKGFAATIWTSSVGALKALGDQADDGRCRDAQILWKSHCSGHRRRGGLRSLHMDGRCSGPCCVCGWGLGDDGGHARQPAHVDRAGHRCPDRRGGPSGQALGQDQGGRSGCHRRHQGRCSMGLELDQGQLAVAGGHPAGTVRDRGGADLEVPRPDTRGLSESVGLAQGVTHLRSSDRWDTGDHRLCAQAARQGGGHPQGHPRNGGGCHKGHTRSWGLHLRYSRGLQAR